MQVTCPGYHNVLRVAFTSGYRYKGVYLCTYSNNCVKCPLSKISKIGFQDQLLLNAGQKYCRMLQGGILQYFRPSLSYHLLLSSLFFSVCEWLLYTGFTVLWHFAFFVTIAHIFVLPRNACSLLFVKIDPRHMNIQ